MINEEELFERIQNSFYLIEQQCEINSLEDSIKIQYTI